VWKKKITDKNSSTLIDLYQGNQDYKYSQAINIYINLSKGVPYNVQSIL